MNQPATLQADAEAIERFVHALFRYAEPGSYVSLRAFGEKGDDRPQVECHQIVDSRDRLNLLSQAAIAMVTRAAQAAEPKVFCSPIATFKNAHGARETDLANGLALSFDLDVAPNAGRQTLESILGPATVVVASGGQWTDPITGEVQPKLHLYWRLTEATQDKEWHAKLKRARALGARLVNGDASNTPLVHPIRWPGSWHRKKEPQLVQILELNESREIDLQDALELLQEAAELPGVGFEPQRAQTAPTPLTGHQGTEELIQSIVTGQAYHEPIAKLAMRLQLDGMTQEKVTKALRSFMRVAPEGQRDIKDGVYLQGRWQSRFDDIPRAVSSARDKIAERAAIEEVDWTTPVDFLADAELTGAPVLRRAHLPDALAGFVFDTAERMGVDPAAVALCAVVACASVASDEWRIQPKVLDDSWVEQPRLWGAVVGDPSIRKSPILRACTRPIEELEEAARKRHSAAMEVHRAQVGQLKADKEPPERYPVAPKQDRYIVEGTTTEALSEVLRDDEEAKQRAPAGKVLVRQDELSEWIASFDAYKGGGRQSADRGAYLRLFNGGRFTLDRVGRGNFAIPNWSGCVLGGIQPEPIQRIARDATDDGLLQRFLYVVPTAENEGKDRKPDAGALARYAALFPVLVQLFPPSVPDTRFAVTFTSDAQAHRRIIENLAKAQANMPDASSRLKAALGKWSGIYARLALTFHLITCADARAQGHTPPPEGLLSTDTAARAANFMREVLFPHLLRAEGLLFLTKQTGHACWIAGFILSSDKVRSTLRLELRDIQRAYRALKAPEHREQLISALQALEVCGWLRAEGAENNSRKVHAWAVNPKLYTAFAARAEAERERRHQTREAILRTLGRGA